jgi:hypothetical protein
MDPSVGDESSLVRTLRWPAVIILLALITASTVILFCRSSSFWPRLRIEKKLTTEFIASIPEVHSTGMGNLELATADATETFSRTQTSELNLGWVKAYLGTTFVEMRVPVTYRYHLKLAGLWQLYSYQTTCVVRAPRIRSSLPPAIHTDGIERQASSGWARFNKGEEMESLEREVTPTLARYASDAKHLSLVREECRKTVADFVKAFLLRTANWDPSHFDRIVVVFEDEPFQGVEQISPVILLHE